MSWGYVAVAAATVVSGAMSSNSAKKAGSAAARGADAATAESGRQYDQTRADLAPYRVTGTGALNQLGRLFGLPTTTAEEFQSEQDRLIGDTMLPADAQLLSTDGGRNRYYDVMLDGKKIGSVRPGGSNGRFTPADGVDVFQLSRQRQQQQQAAQPASGAPDMSAFFQSPGYQFRRDEGMRGTERTAAARGGAFSGNALRALAELNSGLASDEFGQYVNQLGIIAGIGQSSTNQTAAYGADHAATAGRNSLYAADARASGIQGSSNAWGNTLQDLGGIAGYAWGGGRSRIGGNTRAGGGTDPYGYYGGGRVGYA